jgi:quercetin dioxygenase-like cupin family protein
MIRSGDSVVNPVTGERLVFHQTSRDTRGEYCLVETFVQPGGFVAQAHVHPYQTETFTAVQGTLALKAGRERIELAPGQKTVVEAGTAHKFWNPTDDTIRFMCEVRPALQFEALIETMFSLAADGKTNRKGMPNPLRLAVIANAHFDTVRLPFPPAILQRLGLAVGSPLGRAFGYRSVYVPAAPDTAPATA